MEHLFIINPAAGKKYNGVSIRGMVDDIMKSRHDEPYQILFTEYKRHATELVNTYDKGQHMRVYACGGDGTLCETVNAAVLRANIEIACFPCGTGNDFVRIFPEYTNKMNNLYSLMKGLINGKTKLIDAIKCNENYAVNMCCVGLDANIGADMVKYKRIPVLGGKMSYVTSLATNLIKKITMDHIIKIDNEVFSGSHTLISALNGQYYGGGFHPALTAEPDDGLLDFIIAKGIPRHKVPGLVKIYARGELDKLPDLIKYMKGKRLNISAGKPFAVNYDGETMFTNELNVEILHKSLNFVIPAN